MRGRRFAPAALVFLEYQAFEDTSPPPLPRPRKLYRWIALAGDRAPHQAEAGSVAEMHVQMMAYTCPFQGCKALHTVFPRWTNDAVKASALNHDPPVAHPCQNISCFRTIEFNWATRHPPHRDIHLHRWTTEIGLLREKGGIGRNLLYCRRSLAHQKPEHTQLGCAQLEANEIPAVDNREASPVQQWLLVIIRRLRPAVRVGAAGNTKSVLMPVDSHCPHDFFDIFLGEVSIRAPQIKEKRACLL